MATRTWAGTAPTIAQVQDYVFGGTWEADDIVNVKIGTVTVAVVAGSTVITTVVDAVVTAWNALALASYPQFSEITASRSSNSLRLTADTKGNPFVCTVSTTETGGGAADAQLIDGAATSTGASSTANSGPNDWSVASNWAENAVPVAADDVIIDRGSVSILDGLGQSGVTLTSLTIKASYTGKIGRPKDNASIYAEYRNDYLAISATTITIGQGTGTGSGRIKINVGSVLATLNVYSTATSAESGLPTLQYKGTNASNVVNVVGGNVGIAFFSGETATVLTLRQTGGTVSCGTGTTLTTIDKNGGSMTINSNSVTVTNGNGDLTIESGTVTTLTVREGTLRYNSTGTITTLAIYNNAIADFDGSNRARTVTNCVITEGAAITDTAKSVVWTTGIDLYQCGIEAVRLRIGEHFTLTPSAI